MVSPFVPLSRNTSFGTGATSSRASNKQLPRGRRNGKSRHSMMPRVGDGPAASKQSVGRSSMGRSSMGRSSMGRQSNGGGRASMGRCVILYILFCFCSFSLFVVLLFLTCHS